jgi:hypothetical protein
VIKDYAASNERYLSLKEGETVTGFSEEGDWVCGFKD